MFIEVKRKRICEFISEPNPTFESLELEISIKYCSTSSTPSITFPGTISDAHFSVTQSKLRIGLQIIRKSVMQKRDLHGLVLEFLCFF